MAIPKFNTRIVNKVISSNADMQNLIQARNKANLAPAFPFNVYLGATNNTEFGQVANNVEVNNFTQFQKIFTGQDVVLIL